MKNIGYLLIAATIFMNVQTVVFAEDLLDTPATTTQAREAFAKELAEKRADLQALQKEVNAAREENNALVKQIREAMQSKKNLEASVKVDSLEQLRIEMNKTIEAAKGLGTQREALVKEIANKGARNVDDLRAQLADIKSKVESYKQTLTTQRAELKLKKDELTAYIANRKATNEQIKVLFGRTKSLQTSITAEIKTKATYWTEFKDAITNKDYSNALNAYDKIIVSKNKILDDLNTKNTILKDILSKY